MADNDESVTPIQSVSTDHPDAPQSTMTAPNQEPSAQTQYAEGSIVQDAQGHKLRLHNNEWMPVFAPDQMVKNAQGQTLGLDPRTNQWVDVQTGKPYEAPQQAAPAAAAGATPSIGQQAKEIVSDFSKGVGEGALSTVHGVGEAIRGATNVASNAAGGGQIGMGNLGDKIIRPQDQAGVEQLATPANTTQKVGFGAEALLEMMVGDSALKGLSLAEKLTLGSKIAKLAEDYPIVGKILAHGLNAVRGGAAQTAENVVKGQPIGQALGEGATTAAIGTGVGAAAEGASALASHLFNPDTGKITRIAKQAMGGENMAQRPAQIALRTAAGEQGPSVRELLTGPIDRAKSIAKSGYDQVEKATGLDLKVVQQKLDNTVDEINKLTGTEADLAKEAQLEKARTELMDEIDEAKKAATSKGVPADAIDKADAAWKQHKALSEVQGLVFDNEGVIKGNTAHGSPEVVSVDNAIRNLEKLNNKVKYGAPRLQQAFGVNGADRLMKEMYAAQREGIKAMDVQKWTNIAKGALKWSGRGALAAGGYEAAKSFLE